MYEKKKEAYLKDLFFPKQHSFIIVAKSRPEKKRNDDGKIQQEAIKKSH
jgi:hypothetical protein